MSAAQPVLWLEPEMGAVSGGLRYNQQLRQALAGAGVPVETLRLPVPSFAEGAGAEQLAQARQRLCPQLVVIDGLIGSAHPELFVEDSALPGRTVLLVHLSAAAALAAEGRGDPEAVSREKWAVLEADHVLTVSRWSAAELRRRYRRQDIRVAVPGVKVPEPAPVPDSRSQVPQLVSVGALNPLKNHALLSRALQPLLDLDWQLVLAGPGADEPFGQQLLLELDQRLPGRLAYRGVLEPEQLGELWAGAQLLLLPSLVETYGMVVTEACAHGVPAFVSAGTGAEEAAGQAGVPLDPQSPSIWSDRLRRFLVRGEDRTQLREAALRRRRSLPTWDEAAQVLAGLG